MTGSHEPQPKPESMRVDMSLVELAKTRLDDYLARGPAEDRNFRERAWQEFMRRGLPTRKTETWKYSNLSLIEKSPWESADVKSDSALPAELLSEISALNEKWSGKFDVIVLVNGELRRDLSVAHFDKFQITIGPAKLQIGSQPGSDLIFEDGFLGLSAAVSRSGLSIDVPEGVDVARPLLVIRAHVGDRGWASVFNRVRLGRGACLRLAEVHMGPRENEYLRTEITSVAQEADSVFDWIRVQNDGLKAAHISDVQAHLGEGARLNFTQLHVGAQWARSSLRSDLHGVRGEAHIHGLSFGRLQQHLDQRIQVVHRAPQSTSSQLFKSVLKDRARGVLNGRIHIFPDAQKVLSSQLNHNLLLSPGAEADTKPELEIYADDVK
ncbi:MAG: SufD family Fe-S cluster assembly protein, partial [Bdellovibrionales bacterium]